MPKIVDKPKGLKPFIFHGMDLEIRGEQAVGDCPFCRKEAKFYVNVDTSQWHCKVCGGKGNSLTFLRQLHEQSAEISAGSEKTDELLHERRLLYPGTLAAWGVCPSLITGEWLVPGYGIDGKLVQLYRYTRIAGKLRLLATPEMKHGLFGANLYDPKKPNVALTEGPWDGMMLWETMGYTKQQGGEYLLTSSDTACIRGTTSVLATPGCNVFNDAWGTILNQKNVTVFFDNDHPREENGQIFRAGFDGVRKLAETLAQKSEGQPQFLSYLRWGPEGYDENLPNGYDVRDVLSGRGADGQWVGLEARERCHLLGSLLAKTAPIPAEWVPGRNPASASGEVRMELLPCYDWKTLVQSWRKAMKWPEPGLGLDHALAVMLASVVSTPIIGDQLWIKVIGPASCGKSTLCEALSANHEYVLAKSTIRGFHSGFKTDREGEEDHSLLAIVNGKTLVTKDGDTLLQSPNLAQILSEARDVYDRTSRTHYRHGLRRDYEGISMTWILCGTSTLRTLDSSELGERFLDCVIMDGIDEETEREVLRRTAYRQLRNMGTEVNGKAESRQDEDMTQAMQLTGGYVSYLRQNGAALLHAVQDRVLKDREEVLDRCIALGRFVAFMRARPSARQKETAEREFGARLTSQIIRLATCLAVVLNRSIIDDEVLRRTTRVALDTARGRTLELCRLIYLAGKIGSTSKALARKTGHSEADELNLLRFLRRIGAVETVQLKAGPGVDGALRWRLTESMRELFNEVLPDLHEELKNLTPIISETLES